jgi:predicted heme/steroid binding protein
MKQFTLDQLPNDVKERLHSIDFESDLIDDYIGMVNLKDEYEFGDGSHMEGFSSKKDLIKLVRSSHKV